MNTSKATNETIDATRRHPANAVAQQTRLK